MGVILTRNTVVPSAAFTQAEKLILEMEMEFKTASASHFKDLSYSASDELTNIDIWTDSGMTLKLFNKLLSYDPDENLSRTILTRITDGAQIAKLLAYDGSGNLDTITVSAG